ncbi:MAG TPA: tetratricopeptide repeat protein [Chthoniobacterales bacterium]|nr:tetratricopeptide repeat protein [Chthoniobacterales bacterium]
MTVLAILIIAFVLSAPASRAQDTNQLAITYFNRAFEENRMGEHQAAIFYYNETIRLKPDFQEAYASRADAYEGLASLNSELRQRLRQYGKAISDRLEAMRLMYNRTALHEHLTEGLALSRTYYERGMTYFELKQYDQAISDYSHAIRLNSNPPAAIDLYTSRGNAYSAIGNAKAADADFETVKRLAAQWRGHSSR